MQEPEPKKGDAGRATTWRKAEMRQEQHDAKRQLILHQAAVMFADRGFHETTIGQIAEALEVTKPTIYYYVESKEDILFQITQAALTDLDRALADKTVDAMSAIDRLQKFFEIYGRIILSDFGICLALVSDRSLGSESRKKLRLLKKEFEMRVRRIVDDGIADGSIVTDNPRMLTAAIFGAFNWAPQWFSPRGSNDPAEITEAFIRIFRKAIGPS
jgi:AcrR family transcriptional regulator